MNQEKPSRYSKAWTGQDGNEWRTVEHWVGNGWRSFLQRLNKNTGEWEGMW